MLSNFETRSLKATDAVIVPETRKVNLGSRFNFLQYFVATVVYQYRILNTSK